MSSTARDLKQVSATGNVIAGPVVLHSISLTSGADAATLTVRDGSGGAVRLTLKVAAGATTEWQSGSSGIYFSSFIHVTFDVGTSPLASVEFG